MYKISVSAPQEAELPSNTLTQRGNCLHHCLHTKVLGIRRPSAWRQDPGDGDEADGGSWSGVKACVVQTVACRRVRHCTWSAVTQSQRGGSEGGHSL